MPAINEREAKIFRNGRSKAVRIPSEFTIEGESVLISQDGDGVIHIRQKSKKRSMSEMLDWLAEQGPIDFPDIEDRPPEPVDLGK
jgi:antitoxin VapB